MASNSLVCSGAIAIDVSTGAPSCPSGWSITPLNDQYLTAADYSEMWPLFLGLFVTAYIAKALRRMLVTF